MPTHVESFYEARSGTWQYIVHDTVTKAAAIIDAVLDFDAATSTCSTQAADELLACVTAQGLNVQWILETHAHADHLTAAHYLKTKLEGLTKSRQDISVGIGKRIVEVQKRFGGIYGVDPKETAAAFDKLFEDDEVLGAEQVKVLYLPGHTPDHVGYQIAESVFTGDSCFNPDVGTARCDFPGGNADTLFNSMSILLALPTHFRLYIGHDYPPGGSDGRSAPAPFATVGEQRARNKHAKEGTHKQDFVKWRTERDAVLPARSSFIKPCNGISEEADHQYAMLMATALYACR
ncbi:hypothetical protein EMMF5_001466 [Cystobasidiomycetes sp. EMM_F5]